MPETVNANFIANTVFANVASGTPTTGRSSIKYDSSSSEINLFFPITNEYATTCCGSTTTDDCPGTAITGSICAAISGGDGTFADTLILKIIANSYALSLKNDDKD